MTDNFGTLGSFKTFLEQLYLAGVRKAWFGTKEEWEALEEEEKDKHDMACLYEE